MRWWPRDHESCKDCTSIEATVPWINDALTKPENHLRPQIDFIPMRMSSPKVVFPHGGCVFSLLCLHVCFFLAGYLKSHFTVINEILCKFRFLILTCISACPDVPWNLFSALLPMYPIFTTSGTLHIEILSHGLTKISTIFLLHITNLINWVAFSW